MNFYNDFIDKYDTLVSWENRFNRESEFFKILFRQNKINTILDCACGTGQHVMMFNQMGFNATGSDLSPAMIKKAKYYSKQYDIQCSFHIADFRNLNKIFKRKFDSVICVGNSLPHLLSVKDLKTAIMSFYNILNEKSLLIIQQRNYDLFIKTKKRFFPVTVLDNEAFIYALDYEKEKITFNVLNLEYKTKKLGVFKTEYFPLKTSLLMELLKDAGFKKTKLYSDHKFNKFKINESNDLILTCEKNVGYHQKKRKIE